MAYQYHYTLIIQRLAVLWNSLLAIYRSLLAGIVQHPKDVSWEALHQSIYQACCWRYLNTALCQIGLIVKFIQLRVGDLFYFQLFFYFIVIRPFKRKILIFMFEKFLKP